MHDSPGMAEDWLIGSKEAAEILGVDASTISRWADEKLKPEARRLTIALRLPGATGAKLFRRSEVEALAAELAGERA